MHLKGLIWFNFVCTKCKMHVIVVRTFFHTVEFPLYLLWIDFVSPRVAPRKHMFRTDFTDNEHKRVADGKTIASEMRFPFCLTSKWIFYTGESKNVLEPPPTFCLLRNHTRTSFQLIFSSLTANKIQLLRFLLASRDFRKIVSRAVSLSRRMLAKRENVIHPDCAQSFERCCKRESISLAVSSQFLVVCFRRLIKRCHLILRGFSESVL